MATLRNTKQGYGWISILLHWLVALAVFGLFGLGIYMVDLSYYDPWYHDAPEIHKGIGILLLITFAGRFIWRLINPRPEPVASLKPLEKTVSEWVHWLLYLLLTVVLAAGYLIPTAEGRGIDVFGWFTVPALFSETEDLADIAGEIHEWAAWAIVVIAGLHALAALKHHFLDRDSTLRRMLRPGP